MKWEFCNNDEFYEMLSRNEHGRIVATIFIDDEFVTAISFNGERYLIKDFPSGTNLLEVEIHIKEDLNI